MENHRAIRTGNIISHSVNGVLYDGTVVDNYRNYPAIEKEGRTVVDYSAWISRISDQWPIERKPVERNLMEVF